jgi:hypothetical protein
VGLVQARHHGQAEEAIHRDAGRFAPMGSTRRSAGVRGAPDTVTPGRVLDRLRFTNHLSFHDYRHKPGPGGSLTRTTGAPSL